MPIAITIEQAVAGFEGQRPLKSGSETEYDLEAPFEAGVLRFFDPITGIHVAVPLDANGVRNIANMLLGKPIVETARRIIDPRENGSGPAL